MRSTSIVVASLLALSACHKDAPPPPPRPRVTTHVCRIALHPHPAPELSVRGVGNATDQAAATEQAWTVACAALPEAHRASCRDTAHFTPQIVNASMSAGGPTSYTSTITLEPVAGDDSRGQGTSTVSADEACHQATEAACRAAGATGDCIAAHTHDQASRSVSSMTM